LAKFQRNVGRDELVQRELRQRGWDVMVIWECELRDLSLLKARLFEFLGTPSVGSALQKAPA
jgi:DNA mismatch endonuclease (patch repair protein)